MTLEKLAQILSEAFADWGDIDPYLLEEVQTAGDLSDRSEDDVRDIEGMRVALQKAVDALNKD